jgi:folate-binding protein YgfZ
MTKFPPDAAIFPYSPACVLRVGGPDAATFLQGQFTNDLGKIEPGQAVYGLWLDRRGRVIADSDVVRPADGGDFRVVSMLSPAPVVARRLGDFIIADDVAIEDETPAWGGVSLLGAGTGDWLSSGPRPGMVFPGRRDSGENWEWIHPAGDAAAVAAALAGARVLDADQVERLRIAAGIPSVPRDIGPADLPNEGGLESAAISYSKGCYVGQEVMARIRSVGRIRRRLVRVRGGGPAPALPSPLWRAGRREGELRSAVADGPNGGYAGLALVSVSALGAGGPLALGGAGGPQVEVIGAPAAPGPDCV